MPWSVAVSRAYRTPRRYSCIEHPQSWPRSPGSRTHTISGPTADNHQSYPTDAEFHASFRPCIPVRANVLLAFPLTRLRLSVHLRHSPSISRVESFVRLQLHLQHDSLVEDQSTPRLVDFKLPCVDRLESTLRHCMLKRAPLRHAPRVSTPQNLDSISPHAPMSLSSIFTVFCLRQTAQSDPAERIDCNHAPPRVSSARTLSCTTRHLLVHDIHDILQTPRALYARRPARPRVPSSLIKPTQNKPCAN
jgi:hypothetical protein